MQGAAVTASFFDLLGVRTSLGRGFAAHEDRPGTDAVVLFSRRFWQAHFGADPHIIGRELSVNGRTTTVVGIVPDEQAYPAGINAWVPLVLSAEEREERTIQRVTGIARINADVSPAVAADDLARVAGDLAARYPATNRGRGFDLQLLRREQYEFTAPLFLLLQAAAALVLCLGIANAANLFVARTLDRRHELAIRAALGGSRLHVFALVMSEAVVTAGVSGVLAAPIAFWLIGLIRAAVPADIAKWIAGWNTIAVDGPTMIAAVLMTCATGAALGVATGMRAMSVSRGDLAARRRPRDRPKHKLAAAAARRGPGGSRRAVARHRRGHAAGLPAPCRRVRRVPSGLARDLRHQPFRRGGIRTMPGSSNSTIGCSRGCANRPRSSRRG